MISTKQPDGSFVTTPLYVGTAQEVEQMKACAHDYNPGDTIHSSEGHYVIIEYCKHCGAARSRHADSEAVLEKYLTTKGDQT